MSHIIHKLLRKPFFGRFEVPWRWPTADEAAKWERVTVKNSGSGKLVGHPSVVLVYGNDDKFTPPAHGQRLMKALAQAAEAELCVLPNVEHTFAYRDAREEYVASVILFLTNALRIRRGLERSTT